MRRRRTLILAPKRAKPWYRSETVWGNAIGVVLLTAELNFGLLQAVLPGNVYAWLAFALALANALMKMRGAHLEPTGPASPEGAPDVRQ